VALFEVVANVGIAVTPTEEWSTAQVERYVQAQRWVGGITGNPLRSYARTGSSLPGWAPADELFVVGNCDGLYVSNGEDYSTVPSDQAARKTWMTVALGPRFAHRFQVSVAGAEPSGTVQLVRAGGTATSLRSMPSSAGVEDVVMEIDDPGLGPLDVKVPVLVGTTHVVDVVTDATKHLVEMSFDGVPYLAAAPASMTPIVVGAPGSTFPVTSGSMTVHDVTPSSTPALCRALSG
jgi:hypothetical protein